MCTQPPAIFPIGFYYFFFGGAMTPSEFRSWVDRFLLNKTYLTQANLDRIRERASSVPGGYLYQALPNYIRWYPTTPHNLTVTWSNA